MTGSYDDEDGVDSLVIHMDGAATAEAVPDSPKGTPWQRRFRYQLYMLGALLGIFAIAYTYGELTYHPAPRLPELVFDTSGSMFGTNMTVAAELDIVRSDFEAPQALRLEAVGPAFKVKLPRTVADRLFGERDEVLTLFTARSPVGESRFLYGTEGGEPVVIAIEAPLGLSRSDEPTGVFLALDPEDEALGPIVDAVEAILPDISGLDAIEVSPERLYVFGPFQAGNADVVQERVRANRVTAYLADQIMIADGDVSLTASVFLLLPGPSRGRINALYQPARRLVMEPLWGVSATTSLAHELVHAYLDTVAEDPEQLLTRSADYFDQSHPVLYGEVVGDLYERLGRTGRAEETLAFLVGAIAAEQTKTVATQQLLENQGNLRLSEDILLSDVVLLVEAGLLPACMRPETEHGAIESTYYEQIDRACASQ